MCSRWEVPPFIPDKISSLHDSVPKLMLSSLGLFTSILVWLCTECWPLRYGINYRAKSDDWQDFGWGKKQNVKYQKTNTVFGSIFVWSLWPRIYFIACTLILVVYAKKMKSFGCFSNEGGMFQCSFSANLVCTSKRPEVIQDGKICLHWSNIRVNENRPNLTGENNLKNVHGLMLWISVMAK